MQSQDNLEAYCYHCGADWSFWFALNDDQKEKALEENPKADISNLDEACCPICSFPYFGEDEADY